MIAKVPRFDRKVASVLTKLARVYSGPVWLYWINVESWGLATAYGQIPADASHVSAEIVTSPLAPIALCARRLISTLEKRK